MGEFLVILDKFGPWAFTAIIAIWLVRNLIVTQRYTLENITNVLKGILLRLEQMNGRKH